MVVLGMYMIIITKKKKVGDLLGHAVWKALDFDVISYKKTILHLTDNQVQYPSLTSMIELVPKFLVHF